MLLAASPRCPFSPRFPCSPSHFRVLSGLDDIRFRVNEHRYCAISEYLRDVDLLVANAKVVIGLSAFVCFTWTVTSLIDLLALLAANSASVDLWLLRGSGPLLLAFCCIPPVAAV